MSGQAVGRRIGWVALWLATALVCGALTWVAIGYAVRQAEGDEVLTAGGPAPVTPSHSSPSPSSSSPSSSSPSSSSPPAPPLPRPSAVPPVTPQVVARATDGGTVVTACRARRSSCDPSPRGTAGGSRPSGRRAR